MQAVVALVIMTFIIMIIVTATKASTGGGGSNFDKLINNGIAARGILLGVSRTGVRAPGSTMLRRFENRFVTIDIEVPGQPPYETNLTLSIPSNYVEDVLPGATVELRIDRKNAQNIVVVGPGAGFSVAALNAAPTTAGQVNV